MLGWISILIGIVLIIANLKSVLDKMQPLFAYLNNKILELIGSTPAAVPSSTDTTTPDQKTPSAAPTSSTETAPAPTTSKSETPNPPATSPVGATSSVWPVEFFIRVDVLAVVLGITLIYFGVKTEFPPAPPSLIGGKRRRR